MVIAIECENDNSDIIVTDTKTETKMISWLTNIKSTTEKISKTNISLDGICRLDGI